MLVHWTPTTSERASARIVWVARVSHASLYKKVVYMTERIAKHGNDQIEGLLDYLKNHENESEDGRQRR